MPEMRG